MNAGMKPPDTYQGLEFHLNPLRMAYQKLLPATALAVASTSLRLRNRSNPRLIQEPNWIAIKPILSGICGSDLSILRARSSPYLAPLVSFPAVLGHEVVGEVDTENAPWPRGTRVVIDPSIPCQARALTPCPACERGEPDECSNRHHPELGAGMLLGYHRDLPGGWSTRMWAPVTQVHPIPVAMKTRRAVLAEPSSIVWQALSRLKLGDANPTVLIVGAGTVGLLTLWLFKIKYPAATVAIRARYPLQALLATPFGADVVYHDRDDRAFVTSPRLNAVAGEPLPTQWGGWPFRPKGFDIVVDTVGSSVSFYQAATLVRPGGQILLLGGAGPMHVDLTPIWSRRVTLIGSFGYGHSSSIPACTTFDTVVNLLHDTARPVEQLVTHIVPLDHYREALQILDRGDAIKVAFSQPNPKDASPATGSSAP